MTRSGKKKICPGCNIVINGGIGEDEASTIVNCTSGEPEVIREGVGVIEGY